MVSAPLLSLCALGSLVIYLKFSLSHLEAVKYHIYLYLTGIVIKIKCLICGSKGTNQRQLLRNVLLPKRSDENQSEKGKVKLGSSNFRLPFYLLFVFKIG